MTKAEIVAAVYTRLGGFSKKEAADLVDRFSAGEGRLTHVDIQDLTTDEVTRHEVDGLFLLLGADPHCEWLAASIATDDRGFIVTGRDLPQDAWIDGVPPEELATNVPGIYAVGDVRSGSMKRVASAVGEGASVVPMVHRWLAGSASA